jgi:pyruvate ferredoxin oxidoreductase gamma subunit
MSAEASARAAVHGQRAPVFRIRFHGRGGQGIKTASRILGSALFGEGLEVQDAPRYGAERRGAPMFAYVRASRCPIEERGVIETPNLVVVADDSLLVVPAAGVSQGLTPQTVVLIETRLPADRVASFLGLAEPDRVVTRPPPEGGDDNLAAVRLAGAAARLLGLVTAPSLEQAVRREVASLGSAAVTASLAQARRAFDAVASRSGAVSPSAEGSLEPRDTPWTDVLAEPVERSAPAVRLPATTAKVATGLWRTKRPVIDTTRCHQCIWVCGTFCPDNAITRDKDGYPTVDLDHCKGCMICEAVCPFHAISSLPEKESMEDDR